jgi:hypothetical protein
LPPFAKGGMGGFYGQFGFFTIATFLCRSL